MPSAPGSPRGSAYALLAGAAADWDRLEGLLSEQTRGELAVLLKELRAAPDGEEQRAAAEAAARLLDPWLPGDGGRLVNTPSAPGGYTVEGFTAADLSVLVLDGHRMAGPVLGAVRDRLLAAPALSVAEVEEQGGEPYDPGLIRLRGEEGRLRLPQFQFARGALAWPVVLEVNALLGAGRDPWGVADWWLSPNAWLGTEPAQLLGTARESQVADAAHYLVEGE